MDKPTPHYNKRIWLTQAFARTAFRIFFGLKIKGLENIPKTGPFILATNHSSNFDPPIVGGSSSREIFFAAKDELFKIPLLGICFKFLNAIPVKRGRYDRRMLIMLGKLLEAGYGIVMFPEGTRYVDDILHPPRPGIGMLALKYDVPIVPTYISGSAQLGRQLFKRNLRVTFGTPFNIDDSLRTDANRDTYRTVAYIIMEHLAQTGNVLPPQEVGHSCPTIR